MSRKSPPREHSSHSSGAHWRKTHYLRSTAITLQEFSMTSLCLRKVAKWIWRVCVISFIYDLSVQPVLFWLSLHRYWTDFNNFWCFVKLKPGSRRYADLEDILVHFDPPARTISIIANPKIHFHDLHYEVDIYEFYHCYDRYCSGRWVEMHQNTL